ncbi:hypothetical protein K490DRAFT_60076 [Saccharata proteae CBS 121410]|uniref:Methyltransferase type 11 domain-containing protein n=1 Tax=Saccharata proteae CBS 121410 TaxID=1314787 RepID=A0A9P4LRU8_9PEZI|nr:hypothetical protein K490DRAFT_60076 [Saccharata proteae CBS 121410]
MASSKSHLTLPSGSASQPAKLQRKQSSRLPTRSTTPTSPTSPTSPEQHASVTSPTARFEADHASAYRQRALNSTPSPALGSSPAPAHDTPRRVLRKKASSIGRPATHSSKRSAAEHKSCSSESMGAIRNEHDADLVLGIAVPQSKVPSTARSPAPFEHGTRPPDGTEPLPLPHPAYASSTSPSTRYSESPGRFSHSSSPTSMSSHSPGIVFSSKLVAPRARQTSPVRSRPPPVRRATEGDTSLGASQGLPSVRESSNSSSSASTVVPLEINKETRPATTSPLKPTGRYFNGTSLSPEQQGKARPSGISVQTSISVASTHAAPVYPPPELAHLADAPPAQPTAKARPTRPSREGTPDLSRFQQPSPVVQSNLTSLPGRHRRQTSAGSNVLGNFGGPTNSSKTTISPAKSHYDSSPNPSLNSAFSPVSFAPTTRGTTPELSDGEKGLRSGASPTAPNTRKSPSRFGFFTRRNKTEPVVAPQAKERKLLRKGPIAGTGHEGYGKYAGRGRGAALTSVPGSLSRSTSADSNNESSSQLQYSRKGSVASKSEPEMDDFYRDRLAPKVLRGKRPEPDSSLSTDSDAGRSGSSLDSTRGRPSLEVRNDSIAPSPGWKPSDEWSLPTLLPSAMPEPIPSVSPFEDPEFSSRRPSGDVDANGVHQLQPQREDQLPSQDSRFGVVYGHDDMAPLDQTKRQPHEVRLSRHDDVSEGREGNWLKAKKKTLQQKPSRKWNFFQWAQTNSPLQTEHIEDSPVADEESRNEPLRSMPHYALQDGDDQLDMEELERIMQEAVRAGETPMSSRPPSLQFAQGTKQQHESILLPSPPMMPHRFSHHSGQSSSKVYLRNPEWPKPESSNTDRLEELPAHDITRSPSPTQTTNPLSPTSSPPRPSRLARVGRIPPVITQRDRQRRLSNRSFSRPFAPAQPSPALQPAPLFTELMESAANDARPDHPHSDEDPQKGVYSPQAEQEPSPFTYALDAHAGPADSIPEFFAFPRKYSELSYSSTSSFPVSTAVVPPPDAPLQEDEVWNEYDDLIEDVAVLSGPEDKASRPTTEAPSTRHERPMENTPWTTAATSPPKLDPSPDPREVSVHLRRSRLLAAFQALATPSTPGEIEACMTADQEAGLSLPDEAGLSRMGGRLSMTPTRPESACSRISESAMEEPARLSGQRAERLDDERLDDERLDKEPSGLQQRDSRLVKTAESQKDGAVSMANLRFGALMTSKWLSFGRVLFSPAHSVVKSSPDNAVLVLDGLGNDWSYYCALTYPTASIYNLTPTPTSATSPATSPHTPNPLPNHHPIHHASPASPFPFPRSFFAAVILRFPPIGPASVYRSLVSECKRVLRPGGYLELTVLDLDAVRMGNRGRRKVRALKVRLAGAAAAGDGSAAGAASAATDTTATSATSGGPHGSPEVEGVCLRPRCDSFLRLVGRRGFTGVRMCLVGVPVAETSPPPASAATPRPTPTPPGIGSGSVVVENDPDSNNPVDDDPDDPSKLVSRVGRWWYARCFEGADRSLWDDEALRAECGRRGTSFRLLVCCAVKPEKVVRRTVSV